MSEGVCGRGPASLGDHCFVGTVLHAVLRVLSRHLNARSSASARPAHFSLV